MIINEFPPVGESGVQRPLKFLKYLDRAGWDTFVITPQRPPKSVIDESLCREIPTRTRIYRTASLGMGGRSGDRFSALKSAPEAGQSSFRGLFAIILRGLNNILFPLDKQLGWVPFALVKAVLLIKKRGITNVYITAYPYSAFLIGIYLKLLFGNKIRWVADYRDTWQFESLLKQAPKWRRRIIRHADEQVLSACDHAIFVTDYIRELYIKAYPWLSKKSSTITNGYDEDDFSNLQARSWDIFTLLFMGKLNYLATSDPQPLLKALAHWQETDFQLVHIGSQSEEIKAVCSEYKFFRYEGYKSHREALEYALGADINLILLNDTRHSAGIVTGKMFELLRLGKPILALGPKEGIAKEMLSRSHAGEYAYIGDEQAILTALQKLKSEPAKHRAEAAMIREYSREHLCNELIKLYE